jgi:hypothetical protein
MVPAALPARSAPTGVSVDLSAAASSPETAARTSAPASAITSGMIQRTEKNRTELAPLRTNFRDHILPTVSM